MPSVTRQGNILQIGDTLRIESGPVLKSAEATRDLLRNDVTADHYQAPRKATADEIADAGTLTVDGQRLFLDAKGEPIHLGEPMAYLDWVGHQQGEDGATGFYVYRWEQLTDAEVKARGLSDAPSWAGLSDDQRREQSMIWREIGCEPSEEAAMSLALAQLEGA